MRTIFTTGFQGPSFLTLGQSQEAARALTEAQRNALVNQLSAAIDKAQIIDDFFKERIETDPELRDTLGLDYTRFWALLNSIGPDFQVVETVLERLSDPDPMNWTTPTEEETRKIRNWTVGVDELMKILVRHVPDVTAKKAPTEPFLTENQLLTGAATAAVIGVLIYALA